METLEGGETEGGMVSLLVGIWCCLVIVIILRYWGIRSMYRHNRNKREKRRYGAEGEGKEVTVLSDAV
jgi:membrane protein implicated in regulation of membrane protease activity